LKKRAVYDQNAVCDILCYLCVARFTEQLYLQRDCPGTNSLETGLEAFFIRSLFLHSDLTKHDKEVNILHPKLLCVFNLDCWGGSMLMTF